MASFGGTSGRDWVHVAGEHKAGLTDNDVPLATNSDDTIDLSQGGNDTVFSGAGNDTIKFGGAFTSNDHIDGQADDDTVVLNGILHNVSVVFGAQTMINVEHLLLLGGHSYNLKTNDTTVASGASFTVDASALGGSHILNFDGSSESDGTLIITGGSGDDVIQGGNGDNSFDLTHGGHDTITGGNGADFFNMGAGFDADGHAANWDRLDGGDGNDTVLIDGDYGSLGARLELLDDSIVNVENVVFGAGHSYDMVLSDGTIAAGQTMTFDGSALGTADFVSLNGQGEGSVVALGGAGEDNFVVGTGHNTLTGGGAGDTLQLREGGHNRIIYTAAGGVAESTGVGFDDVNHFDFRSGDKFDLPVTVKGIDTAIQGGTLDYGSDFDAELAGLVDGGGLKAHHAVLFTPDDGNVSGRTFLIVDANGEGGYQGGEDYVIWVSQPEHLSGLNTKDFI